MRRTLIYFALNRSWLLIAVSVVLGGIAIQNLFSFETGALKLPIDSSLTGLLPARGEHLETYLRAQEAFGGDDVLLVAWYDDELFARDNLKRMRRLSRRLRRIDGVVRVDSIATALSVSGKDGDVRIERFLKRIPKSAQGLDALRKEIAASPLYGGQLLSRDGRGTVFAIYFEPQFASARLSAAVEAVEAASAEEAGPIDNFVTGPVHARLEISRILFRDIQGALPLAILVTAIIAALSLRNVRGVLLPLLSTGLGLTITLASFAAMGNALNFVTAIVPPVVFVIGFAFAIHVVSEFDRGYTAKADKKQTLVHVINEVFLPLTLTALTTSAGFASLATSSIGAIKAFGIYTALGTITCWLFALLLIPALLAVFPTAVTQVKQGPLTRFAPHLAAFNLRHRAKILIAGAVIAVSACLAATDLEISTDYLSNFPEDSEVRQNFARIKNEFAGAVPLQIIVSSELEGAFNDPIHLASLKSLETWLEAQPEIGKATTLVDFVELLHRSFEPEEAVHNPLPATREEVEDLFFLTGGDDLERFVDRRKSTTIFHLQTSAISTQALVALVNRIEKQLADSPLYFDAEVTGSSALLSRTLDDIVRGQITSLFGALLVIYFILLALFGSAWVAALALLPNLLPIVCFFGLLGVTGITLNLSTSLVAAVVLGIAVDDTMHFLSRFNTEARRVANEAEGLGKALASVIRPVTYTTAALCCGFYTLTFGELRSQIEFGILAASTLLIAWVIDLTFTPALAGRLRFVTLWEALTVDLGKAPNETIPFFAGLTNRQARVAALLGSIKTFKQGEPILTFGEEGGEIHVVIDGEAVAYLSREDHEEILRPLKRGDLIGEVTLFRGGLRTANVRATSDMRLLHLSHECMARIQHRYPKIGAQLYRNLGVILADRLADITERL